MTRAFPSTIKAVVAVPVCTTIPSLNVARPTASTFVTSSYVNVPPIETFPANEASPANVDTQETFKLSNSV